MYSYNYTTESKSVRTRSQNDMRYDQQIRILVIDDNRDFTNTICSLFNRLGYKANGAYDKEEAMQLVREVMPDLIFCNIGLPNGGSNDVLNRIKSDQSVSHAVLVALTGYSHEVKKLETGFDYCLSKPIQTSILQDILQKVQARKSNLNRKKSYTGAR